MPHPSVTARLLRLLVFSASAVVVGGLAYWYLGITSKHDLDAFVGMALECDPVWKDLALRRVYHGQAVNEVIAKTKPTMVVEHGRFAELRYQEPGLVMTGLYITAIDGRLAQAGAASCTWNYTFFDSMTEADEEARLESLDANEQTITYEGHVKHKAPR